MPPRPDGLSSDEVRAICEHYRLPPPARIQQISQAWMHVNFGLYFDGGGLVLHRVVCEPGWDTLHRELAALTLARGLDGVPMVARYQILPDGLIPGRASLSTLLPGTQLARLKEHPGFLSVCREVGAAVRALSEARQRHFGTSPNGSAFLPTAPTWREEWRRHTHQWAARAQTAGELQHHCDLLEAEIAERLDALDTVTEYCLVHGDLHSGNFMAAESDGTLTLSGVIDWDQGLAGDHLVDWAVLINAPSEALAAIVEGYGRDRVRAMLEPEPLARVEAYAMTHVLARIGALSLDLFTDPRLRAMAVTLAAGHADAILEPGAVASRLEDALGGTGSRAEPVAAPVPVLARRALQVLVSGPPLRADQANDILLALAAPAMAHLAASAPGDGVAGRYVDLGHGVLDSLGPRPQRFNDAEPVSLGEVKTRVFEAILARPGPGMSVAIAVLAACVTAEKRCAGSPTRGLWAGVSALVEALLFIEEHAPPVVGVGRLAHALIGLDAAHVLDAGASVVARYGAVLTEFGGIDSGQPGQARVYLDQGPPPGVPTGAKGKALVPLILAMVRLEASDRLRVPADAILRQLGYLS